MIYLGPDCCCSGSNLCVYLTDCHSYAVSGAYVVVKDSDGTVVGTCFTNAYGACSSCFTLPQSYYTLTFSKGSTVTAEMFHLYEPSMTATAILDSMDVCITVGSCNTTLTSGSVTFNGETKTYTPSGGAVCFSTSGGVTFPATGTASCGSAGSGSAVIYSPCSSALIDVSSLKVTVTAYGCLHIWPALPGYSGATVTIVSTTTGNSYSGTTDASGVAVITIAEVDRGSTFNASASAPGMYGTGTVTATICSPTYVNMYRTGLATCCPTVQRAILSYTYTDSNGSITAALAALGTYQPNVLTNPSMSAFSGNSFIPLPCPVNQAVQYYAWVSCAYDNGDGTYNLSVGLRIAVKCCYSGSSTSPLPYPTMSTSYSVWPAGSPGIWTIAQTFTLPDDFSVTTLSGTWPSTLDVGNGCYYAGPSLVNNPAAGGFSVTLSV